jgi:GntR family transcriptional regulator/MocR family aminotransferase
MNYHIDSTLAIPAYMQLYKSIVQDIISEIYPYGSRLPSKRTIAEEIGVSVVTVEHALALLNDEGYIETRQRSGYFVTYRKSDFYGNPVIQKSMTLKTNSQASNIGDFPYSVIAKTMRKVLVNYGDRILIKSPNSGCDELRIEICAYLARSRGITVKPSQIIVGSGAEYLYGLIAQLFSSRRKFALEQPSYDKIRKVYEAMGLQCDMLSLTLDGIASTELERTDATILHVTPFNSFPSTVTASISKKHEYLRWARQRDGFIIEDNYDSELTVSKKAEDSLFSISKDNNVVYVNTFSKTIAPSVRIGYMILPERLLEDFQKRLGFYSCTVPLFEQYVLAELLRNGDFERHINRVRRKRRKAENR